MITRGTKLSAIIIFLLALLVSQVLAAIPPTYKATVLIESGRDARLNDLGHVTFPKWEGDSNFSVWLWRDGIPVQVPGLNSVAAINNQDHIGGGIPGDPVATVVNPDGSIVSHDTQDRGSVEVLNNRDVFAWNGSTRVNMHGGTVDGIFPGKCKAISDQGQVAGRYAGNDQIGLACVWADGTLAILDTLNSQVTGINNRNQASGTRWRVGAPEACVWDSGVARWLPRHPDSQAVGSVTNALNDLGQIVGQSIRGWDSHATLWQDGSVYDLNDLISGGSRYILSNAIDINNAGQILVWGGIPDAHLSATLLLTPETGGRKVWRKGIAMVSVPSIPWEADPRQALGLSSSYWYSYSPATNSYAGYADQASWLTPAESTPVRGFWAKFDKDTPAPFWIIPPQGEPAVIPLSRGWNLIGQPFLLPVAWDLDTVQVRTSDGLIRSLGEAKDCVSAYAWGWRQSATSTGTGSYYPIADSTVAASSEHTLQPWEGYWVRALKPCDLILPVPDNGISKFPADTAPASYTVQDLGEIPDSATLTMCVNDFGDAAFGTGTNAWVWQKAVKRALPVQNLLPRSFDGQMLVGDTSDGMITQVYCSDTFYTTSKWHGKAFWANYTSLAGESESKAFSGAYGLTPSWLTGGDVPSCVYSGNDSSVVGQAGSRACRWYGWQKTFAYLGLAAPSCARDVNYQSVIAGYEGDPESGNACRAFIWEDGKTSYPSIPTGYASMAAFSLNDYKRAVGVMYKTGAHQDGHAFLWADGTTHDLNSMIPQGTGWELTWAQEINVLNQIIGEGRLNGKRHVVLLSPK